MFALAECHASLSGSLFTIIYGNGSPGSGVRFEKKGVFIFSRSRTKKLYIHEGLSSSFSSIASFVRTDGFGKQDLERAVRLLLNKSGDTNRFIRDDAHTALLAVTQYVSPPKAIAAITAEGLRYAKRNPS